MVEGFTARLAAVYIEEDRAREAEERVPGKKADRSAGGNDTRPRRYLGGPATRGSIARHLVRVTPRLITSLPRKSARGGLRRRESTNEQGVRAMATSHVSARGLSEAETCPPIAPRRRCGHRRDDNRGLRFPALRVGRAAGLRRPLFSRHPIGWSGRCKPSASTPSALVRAAGRGGAVRSLWRPHRPQGDPDHHLAHDRPVYLRRRLRPGLRLRSASGAR